jgi:hypothetical protein
MLLRAGAAAATTAPLVGAFGVKGKLARPAAAAAAGRGWRKAGRQARTRDAPTARAREEEWSPEEGRDLDRALLPVAVSDPPFPCGDLCGTVPGNLIWSAHFLAVLRGG